MALIRRLELTNFGCFPGLSLELSPLTVFVGPNDSGKSTVLAALRALPLLAYDTPGNLRPSVQEELCLPSLRWTHASADDPTFLAVEGSGFRLAVTFGAGDPRETLLVQDLRPAAGRLSYDRARGLVTDPPYSGGWHVPADPTLFRLRPDQPHELEGLMNRVTEVGRTLRTVVFHRFDPAALRNPSPAPEEDRLAFLTLLHQPNPPALILIEEPENGVHPTRLRDILRLLRRLTEAEDGRPQVQVVMTTHSPYLLDEVKPSEAFFFHRRETGAAEATRFDTVEKIEERLAEYGLGELWTAYGEKKLRELATQR